MNLLQTSKIGLAAMAISASVGIGASASVASARTHRPHALVTAQSFTHTFSAMKALRPLAAKGSGKIAEILPDTTTSTRYVEFDAPDFIKAAKLAGLKSSDIISQNGHDSDTQFITDVKADITNGAKVILIDAEDSGTGVTAEKLAAAHHVKIINYDRLVLGGPADPYVSFNNVQVGTLIGKGFVKCADSWLKGTKPNVIIMHGAPTDNNASLFTKGYMGILNPLFKSGKYIEAQDTPGTWNPTSPAPDALDEFKAAFTAHPTANSALIPNDENDAPIINYLQSKGTKPFTFPTTGQDATMVGLHNILAGYQCGTVYKAEYKEAQAAVALALYLRANKKAPKSLLNGVTVDPQNHKKVASVLLTPSWVTTKNMKATIVADHDVPVHGNGGLCSGVYAKACKKFGV